MEDDIDLALVLRQLEEQLSAIEEQREEDAGDYAAMVARTLFGQERNQNNG